MKAQTLTEWKAKAERLAASTKRAREATKEIGERVVGGLATVGTGYAVGVSLRKYGDKAIPGTEIPMIPAAAAVMAIAGAAGGVGQMSSVGAAIGFGGLGGYAAVKGFQG